MTDDERDRFDGLLDEVLASIPTNIVALLDEAPLIVEDRPSPQLAAELDLGDDIICGLHSGTSMLERSFGEGFDHPETIHLFREGILELAGGWHTVVDEHGERDGGPDAIREEIRITLLHEIGHHFGLDEDDLERLGYA